MAQSTAAFERIIKLQLAKVKAPEFQKRHADAAKKGLSRYLAAAKTKPAVITIVDGRAGAREEEVKYGGVIRYEFHRISEAAAFALKRARELSPVKSGRYKESWFAMAGGKPVEENALPGTGEIIITNDQPYHRKLEMTVNAEHWRGKARARLPAGIVERVRQEVLRQYPGVHASVSFITLQGGYVLKGRANIRLAKQNRQSSAFRAGRKHLAVRKDTAAGQQMTYPAVILRPA